MGTPYWGTDRGPSLPRAWNGGPVDVVVVGGGVTGCASALALAEGGLRVRVYEAQATGAGASGRNGGFALRGGALAYDSAREQLGRARAAALWRLTERYLDRLAALAGDAFERTGSLRLAATPGERRTLGAELAALREDGFEVEWHDLPPQLARRFHGALLHPSDGTLHPARWVRRLARLAAAAGADLVEGVRVESLADVAAEQVVIATDGYTRGLLPALDEAVRPTRGQMLATEPLRERLFTRPHYARHGYDYWQQTPDTCLLVGGRRDVRLDDEYTDEEWTTPEIQAEIEALVHELLGYLPRITHRWSALFGMTADRLPLAGPVPGHHGVWAACGYSGHGNVLGLACGELVAQAILGRVDPLLALFDPGRALRVEAGDAVQLVQALERTERCAASRSGDTHLIEAADWPRSAAVARSGAR